MKLRSMTVALAATAALAACGGSSSGTNNAKVNPPPSSDLFTSGTLTIGSDVSYPPQEFFATPGAKEASGFDVDLGKKLADTMGLNFAVVNQNFDGIIPALDAKKFDIIISAMTINDERKQKVQFVPYFSAGESFVVSTTGSKLPTKLADLCGLNVAVEKGTAEETEAKGLTCPRGKVGVQSYDTDTEALTQLAKGTVDVHFTDSPVAAYEIKQHNNIKLSGGIIEIAPEGIAIRKNDSAMFTAITAAFKQLKDDGTYASLLSKWGLSDGDITKAGNS